MGWIVAPIGELDDGRIGCDGIRIMDGSLLGSPKVTCADGVWAETVDDGEDEVGTVGLKDALVKGLLDTKDGTSVDGLVVK